MRHARTTRRSRRCDSPQPVDRPWGPARTVFWSHFGKVATFAFPPPPAGHSPTSMPGGPPGPAGARGGEGTSRNPRGWAAALGASAAGGALLASFPPYGLWWLAPIAVALLAISVRGRRVRTGLGLGMLTGLVFFAPLLSWTNLHVGAVP